MLASSLVAATSRCEIMNANRITVLEFELRAVKALRSSHNIDLVRVALDREEELEQQIATLRGAALKLAACFVGGRDADPDPKHGPAKCEGGRE